MNGALKLDPKLASAHYIRGGILEKRGNFAAASKDFDQAMHLQTKGEIWAYDGFAWLYATCPDAHFRDGAKAVEYARKACEGRHAKNPIDLDTLAAAYAEKADFPNAIKAEEEAIRIGRHSPDLSDMQQRLALQGGQAVSRASRTPDRGGPEDGQWNQERRHEVKPPNIAVPSVSRRASDCRGSCADRRKPCGAGERNRRKVSRRANASNLRVKNGLRQGPLHRAL